MVSRVEVVARLRAAGCVFAEDEARLLVAAARSARELDELVERRVNGEPLEYVLGWAEFCGLRVAVAPGVFVPRRRTELLVREAAARAPGRPVVVDLCCGTGALGVALAAHVPGAELWCTDVDPVAVACARRNVPRERVYQGDLFDALPRELRGRVDVLLANVPYVPRGELELLPREARLHEHAVALDGGADGLAVLRRVMSEAAVWLAPGGSVFCETSEAQAASASEVIATAGLEACVVSDDEIGATVVIGTRAR